MEGSPVCLREKGRAKESGPRGCTQLLLPSGLQMLSLEQCLPFIVNVQRISTATVSIDPHKNFAR